MILPDGKTIFFCDKLSRNVRSKALVGSEGQIFLRCSPLYPSFSCFFSSKIEFFENLYFFFEKLGMAFIEINEKRSMQSFRYPQ